MNTESAFCQLKKQLNNFIFSNNVEKGQSGVDCLHKILGVEIEHFIVDDQGNSVFYFMSGKAGIKDILEELSVNFEEKIYSQYQGKQYLIGLKNEQYEISLEPGSQLEVSLAPASSIDTIKSSYEEFLSVIEPLMSKYGYRFLYTGYRHDKCALQVPLIPKYRYLCMDAHFKNVNSHGACMMRNTASVQVSVDFSDRQDCQRKLKVAALLSPLIYFLFDNSSFFEKCRVDQNDISISGYEIPKRMVRHCVWSNTDNDRNLIPKELFESDFSIDAYIDYICNKPLIYAPSDLSNLLSHDGKIDLDGHAFYPDTCIKDIFEQNTKLSNAEISHIISMFFFDVRIKNFLEVRAADCVTPNYIFAYCAFIKGILYNSYAISKIISNASNVQYQDYLNTIDNLREQGWSAKVYGQDIKTALNYIINLCLLGLNGKDRELLMPIKDIIAKQKTCVDMLSIDKSIIYEKTYEPVSETQHYSEWQKDYFLKNDGCVDNRSKFLNKHINNLSIYENRVVDSCYFAKVYGQETILQFHDVVRTTYNIWKKVMERYFSDADFRSLFKWDDFSKKLIDFRPAYSSIVPISRIDLFFDDLTGKFKICEFNTGGSAAQAKVSYLTADMHYSEPFGALAMHLKEKNINLMSWELFENWVKTFIDIYDEWATNTGHIKSYEDGFTVAIADFLENSQIVDFKLFKDAFKRLGYKCQIVDIRDLKYNGECLSDACGNTYHAIYKRATLNDILPLQNDPGLCNFIDAVFDNNVCPIDWFNTQIIHDKQIFCILQHPMAEKILSPSEIAFVKQHIPATVVLNEINCDNPDYVENKKNYIVKPLNGRMSKDIYSGVEHKKEEWISILSKCAKDNNFIIQEFCKQYTSPNIEVNQDHPEYLLDSNYKNIVSELCNMPGLYCYNGRFSGIYLRQGNHKFGSTQYNVTTPTFYTNKNNSVSHPNCK